MTAPEQAHQRLQGLLQAGQWDEAQNYWLELAEPHTDRPEFLLLLVQEFVQAGQLRLAADLSSLIAPALREAGKFHEWLHALKLQAREQPRDKALRTALVEAYLQLYQVDPRLRAILQAAGLDAPDVPLPEACGRVDALLALAPGSFCRHKSWGFGEVRQFDAILQRLVVSFPHNPDHTMQLAYAAESLVPVSPDHLEVRKRVDLAGLRRLAGEEPLQLLRAVLISLDRRATADQIESVLAGGVIEVSQWRKWWEQARKLMKQDPHFQLPARKNEPFVLRAAPISQQDEFLEGFRAATGVVAKVEVVRRFLRSADDFADSGLLLDEFADGLLEAIRQTLPGAAIDRLEGYATLVELATHRGAPQTVPPAAIADLLRPGRDWVASLDQLSAPALRWVMAELKRTQPESLLAEAQRCPARVLDEMADLLPTSADRLRQQVQNMTAGPELLYWLAKGRVAANPPAWFDTIPPTALLAAILDAMEGGAGSGTKKLREFLLSEESLLTDLLGDAPADTIRDTARRLMTTRAFEEIDRRSLLGRLVKEFPFIQELLQTRTVREQPLVVSWVSFEKRRSELEEIVQKKIPQNSKEIAQARSYGDLRENFEYKAAKDMQKLLMRRRAELENLLARAQPTDFSDARADSVQIGTSVRLTEVASNQPHAYHILGAWDSDPDRGIISYPAALAQTLLGKRVGETVETESGQLRVDQIERVAPALVQSLQSAAGSMGQEPDSPA